MKEGLHKDLFKSQQYLHVHLEPPTDIGELAVAGKGELILYDNTEYMVLGRTVFPNHQHDVEAPTVALNIRVMPVRRVDQVSAVSKIDLQNIGEVRVKND